MNNEQMTQARNKVRKKLTPLRAIKNYCRYHCCCYDTISWKKCTLTSCFLYDFRMGSKTIQNKKLIEKQGVLPINFIKNEALNQEIGNA